MQGGRRQADGTDAGAEQIVQYHDQGESLPQYGGQRAPGHAHVQTEDKHRVQYGVEYRAGEGTEHGVGGTSIGPDQGTGPGGKGDHRQAEGGNARVDHGVGQYLRRSAKQVEEWASEKHGDQAQGEAEQRKTGQSGAGHPASPFLISGP